jgi:hypothetical protein
MSLDLADALSDGLRRTFERSGLLLVASFLALGLVSAVSGQTISAAATRFARDQLAQLPPDAFAGPGGAGGPPALPGPEQTPLALPVPLPVALLLLLAVALLAEGVRIVAVRTLVSDETDTIPGSLVTRNIAVATLNGFVGGVVVFILVGVGLLLFVVPGIFLALSFFFVRQEIAVADRNFVDALSASWELTSGHRLVLFALALVLFVVTAVVSLGISAAVGVVGSPLLTTGVTVAVGAVTTVFSVAVTSRAYVQLTDTDRSDDEAEESEWKFDPV